MTSNVIHGGSTHIFFPRHEDGPAARRYWPHRRCAEACHPLESSWTGPGSKAFACFSERFCFYMFLLIY